MPSPRAAFLLVASSTFSLSFFTGCIGVSAKKALPPGAVEFRTCRAGTRPADDGMVDDFEDGNTQLSVAGGRDGYWWSAHDPNGSTLGPEPFAPSDGGADGSAMAIHVFGKTATGNATDA